MSEAAQDMPETAVPPVVIGEPPPPPVIDPVEAKGAAFREPLPPDPPPATNAQEGAQETVPESTLEKTPELQVPPAGDEAGSETKPETNTGGSPPGNGSTTQTHAQTIGSTHTYQAQNNNVTNNNYYGPEAKAAEARQHQENTSFKDPLEPLPRRPEAFRNFRVEIPAELARGPETHRVILISAFRQEISLAAAYTLIESTSLSSYTAQALVLDNDEHRHRTDLNIDLFNRPEIQKRRDEVVLVDIDREGLFLDSIRSIGLLHASGLGESLRKRDTVVICSLSAPIHDGSTRDSFFHWHVEFLPAALLLRFSKEEAERLHARLEEQWKLNLWGATREDCYQQVWGYLQKGTETLRAEIERRQEFIALSPIESLDKIQPVKAVDVFQAESPPHEAILYTAVYFPGLTLQDFGFLVRAILGDQKTTVEAEEQIVTKRGEVQTLRKKTEKMWVDLWRNDADRLLGECRLESVAKGDGTHVVDFIDPYLRKELRVYLESSRSMFVLRTFERLLRLELLFSPQVSSAIVERLIRLTVERTISDPSYFGKDRLLGFVISRGISFEEPSSVGEALALLVGQEHFYDRLSQLVREMLQRSSLRGTVRSFLEHLLDVDADLAQDLLFGLLDRLRYEPQFQGLVFIRALLDKRVADGFHAKVYGRLVAFMMRSGSRVYSVLEEIATWLPAADLEIAKYSQSNEDALRLLEDYCFYSLGQFPNDSRGEWPSTYDLFAALSQDPAATAERVSRLASWLTHPGMASILVRDKALSGLDSDPERLFLKVVAYFVEEWLLILEGVGPRAPAREASALAGQVLRAVAVRLNEPQRRQLVRGWQTRQQEYMQRINSLPVRERSQREQLLTRRRKLLELQQRFQGLPVDRGATRRREKP